MQWLRLYSEARIDNKLRMLTDAQHRVWFNLLCYAGEQPQRGTIDACESFMLAIECANGDEELLLETLGLLVRLRIIEREEDGVMHFAAWDERQYDKPSDRPEATAERKRRSRERARSHADDPSLKEESRDVTPSHTPEQNRTDTEQSRDTPPTPQGERGPARNLAWVLQRVKSGKCTKRDPPPFVPEFDVFWSQVVRKEPSKKEAYWSWLQVLLRGEEPPSPEDVLAGLGRMLPVWERFEDKTKIPHITTWLNQDRWTVEEPTGPARASPPLNGRATAQDFLDLMHKDANESPRHAETVIDAAYSVSDGQALGAGGQRHR